MELITTRTIKSLFVELSIYELSLDVQEPLGLLTLGLFAWKHETPTVYSATVRGKCSNNREDLS